MALLAGAAWSCLSLQAQAQTQPQAQAQAQAAVPGQEVVVTAARGAQPLVDASAHTTVITREEIEASQAIDLASLLARESGVELASNGGRGTATSVFLRGAPARQVLILVDGVPLARQDASGQVGIEHLMLDQVERVEVVRGNLSALYGAGAVGGVIQVFTRAGQGRPGLAVQVQAGRQGLAQAGAHAALQLGAATRLDLDLGSLQSRGQSVLDPAQVAAANPDRDGYANRSLVLNLGHTVAEGHRLGLMASHVDGKTDYDSAFASPSDVQRSRTRISMLALSSDNRISGAWSSRVTVSEQRERAHYDETGEFGYNAHFDTTVRSLNWLNSLRLGETLQATAGLDLQRQSIAATDNFGGDYTHARTLSALFGALQAQLGTHQLQLQLRQDHVTALGSHGSARASWGWNLQPAWRVFASLANAFSVPPLGYLYSPFGNPDLKPEQAKSAELGLQWSEGAQRVRATWFASRVRDELDYSSTSFRFENIARTRNRGLELSASGRLGTTELHASLTAQDPEDGSTGEQRLRRARVLASASAQHDFGGGWRAGLAWRHASSRPDGGGVRLAAYDVADLTAQWDFSRGWQCFARVENLGNARYQTAANYAQPERSGAIGLRWRGDL